MLEAAEKSAGQYLWSLFCNGMAKKTNRNEHCRVAIVSIKNKSRTNIPVGGEGLGRPYLGVRGDDLGSRIVGDAVHMDFD